MERNFDKVISEMLIQLANIEIALQKQNDRMESFDKRMELTIRRMVKAESRLEQHDKRMEGVQKRMELFDKKLQQSIDSLKEFTEMQSRLNQHFLDSLKNGKGK